MRAVLAALLLAAVPAYAHDHGHPELDAWYEHLMQPDNPVASCCGEADSYWVDGFEQDKGQYVAIVTDDRPDEPMKRRHVEIGTRIVIPNNKIKWNEGNPTGHGVLFMSRSDYVFCYVPPGGV